MVPITVEVSNELAEELRIHTDQLPHILELGLRALHASDELQFEDASIVLEFLAKLPLPEEVLALRPSATLEARVQALLAKNRTDGLSITESEEWERYQYLEHIVRLAKIQAQIKLDKPV